MKKILLCLFVIVAIFSITGCGCSKENKEEDKPEVVDNTLVTINGLEFHLTKETAFKDLKYTIVEDFRELNFDHYVEYKYYQESGPNLLFFRVFYYEGKDFEASRKDLGLDDSFVFEDGKTNNIEYKMIDEHRTDGTIHFYFINKDNNTYVLHFASQYDIKDFETKVVNSVKF